MYHGRTNRISEGEKRLKEIDGGVRNVPSADIRFAVRTIRFPSPFSYTSRGARGAGSSHVEEKR